jgi:hypothetical protein
MSENSDELNIMRTRAGSKMIDESIIIEEVKTIKERKASGIINFVVCVCEVGS